MKHDDNYDYRGNRMTIGYCCRHVARIWNWNLESEFGIGSLHPGGRQFGNSGLRNVQEFAGPAEPAMHKQAALIEIMPLNTLEHGQVHPLGTCRSTEKKSGEVADTEANLSFPMHGTCCPCCEVVINVMACRLCKLLCRTCLFVGGNGVFLFLGSTWSGMPGIRVLHKRHTLHCSSPCCCLS
jgi:hypothetical protein